MGNGSKTSRILEQTRGWASLLGVLWLASLFPDFAHSMDQTSQS